MADMESAHHSEQIKTNLKSRLNRIEGQVRAINRMIDDDVYCCLLYTSPSPRD